MGFPFETQALKIQQPFGEFFVAIIPSSTLLKVTFPDRLRVTGRASKGGQYPLAGLQREDRASRLSEIGRFIDSSEAVFPTPIVLAANYGVDGDGESVDDELKWQIVDKKAGGYRLIIPTDAKLASIVDGQHRLLAFENSERKEMDLACSIFFDLPNPYQAYLVTGGKRRITTNEYLDVS